MEFINYLKDNKLSIYVNNIGFIFLSAFMLSEDIKITKILVIGVIWMFLFWGINMMQYNKRRHYHEKIEQFMNGLDKKYLITDIVDFSGTSEDRFYTSIIRLCNKSMQEEIYKEKTDRIEYKEYIEQWIHEIKNPLSTIKLICINNRSDATSKILLEMSKINNFVEQVLFYTRSENVEKDYLIRDVKLSQIVSKVLVKNKQQLIQNGVLIDMEQCQSSVLTDEKWLEFIVTQIINNCVQYKKSEQLVISIKSEDKEGGTEFTIKDNGIGILESDLPRIFEKGYTGKNGRKNMASTGLGLYLCKKLCDKLGVDIWAQSYSGEGTSIKLFFLRGGIKEM